VVKWVDKFIYLGSGMQSEGKIDGEANRRIQNSSKLYQIIKRNNMEHGDPKTVQDNKQYINYAYFKPIPTYNAKIWNPTK
jgi:hypothetical protein